MIAKSTLPQQEIIDKRAGLPLFSDFDFYGLVTHELHHQGRSE
jgi:hypothetical protein